MIYLPKPENAEPLRAEAAGVAPAAIGKTMASRSAVIDLARHRARMAGALRGPMTAWLAASVALALVNVPWNALDDVVDIWEFTYVALSALM